MRSASLASAAVVGRSVHVPASRQGVRVVDLDADAERQHRLTDVDLVARVERVLAAARRRTGSPGERRIVQFPVSPSASPRHAAVPPAASRDDPRWIAPLVRAEILRDARRRTLPSRPCLRAARRQGPISEPLNPALIRSQPKRNAVTRSDRSTSNRGSHITRKSKSASARMPPQLAPASRCAEKPNCRLVEVIAK